MLARTLHAATMATALVVVTVGAASSEELQIGGTGAAQGIAEKLGQAFSASHPADTVTVVPGLGSTGGIAATLDGVLQIALSGRPLKAKEREQGARGAELIETPFIFVTSHPKAQKLTATNVVEIFGETLKTWPDGSTIKPILRPRSDAASAFLIDNLKGMEVAMEVLRKRPDVVVAATDQDNRAAAERVPNSLAGMTLVQFVTERPRLRIVEFDGTEPSVDAMQAGRYWLKTRLHIVQGPRSSGVADRFMAFLKTPLAAKIILENGGVPLLPRTMAGQ